MRTTTRILPLLLLATSLALVGTGCGARAGRPALETPPPAPVPDAAAIPTRLALGPMIGHITDRSARFWVQAEGPGTLEAIVAPPEGEPEDEEVALSGVSGFAGVVAVDDLEPETGYTVRFTLDGAPIETGGPVTFRTFPSPGQPVALRIAVVSCARTAWDSVQTIWQRVAEDRPDVVVWLGDNNYFEEGDSLRPPDWSDPALMAAQYAALRGLPTLQPLLRQAAHYAIWDDHDYADDQPDRTWPLKEEVNLLFERFWANAYYGAEGLDGVWSHFQAGDVEVFLLDGRYWRDPEEAPDGPGKTMLGEAQKRWLMERLAASRARLKLVAIGVQVLADYHEYDGYHQYATERRELLQWIRDQRIGGVVFLTGDRHLSELMRDPDRIGYPLYELTASPVANRFFATGLEQPNPIRIGGYAAGYSYGLLDIDTTRPPGRLVFRLKDAEGREVLRHEITLDQLVPAAP